MNGMAVRYPALPLAAGMLAGVPAAMAVSWSFLWILLGTVGVLALCMAVSRRWSVLFLSGFTVIFVLSLMMKPHVPEGIFGEKRQWTGRVESCRHGERSGRYIVTVLSPDGPFRSSMTVTSVFPTLYPGDYIRFEAAMERCGRYDGIPGLGRDAGTVMADRLSAECMVREQDVERTGRDGSWFYSLQNLRYDFADAVYCSPLSALSGRLIVGSWLGGGDAGDDVRDVFRATGLSHLLCVSGFHTAVIAAVFTLLLFPFRLWSRGGRWCRIAVAFVVWAYAVMTGFMPSAVRASVMVSVYILAGLMQRDSRPLNALCLAVAVILLINPFWLYSVGFQLSVAAVAGLVLLASAINPVAPRRRIVRRLTALFAVPLAAMVGTAPVVLYHFHTLPLLSIPANAVASIVFPLIMCGGFVVTLLSVAGIPAYGLARCVDVAAKGMTDFCGLIADSGIHSLDGIYLSPWSMLALCTAIVSVLVFVHVRHSKVRLFAASGTMACLLLAGCGGGADSADELLVCGDRTGTDIVMTVGGKAYVLPLSPGGRPRNDYSHYLECRGMGVDINLMSMRRACTLKAGNLRIAIAGKGFTACAPEPDILLVDRLYRGDSREMISVVKPRMVIVASSLAPDKAREIVGVCREAGIGVRQLAESAYRRKLTGQ